MGREPNFFSRCFSHQFGLNWWRKKGLNHHGFLFPDWVRQVKVKVALQVTHLSVSSMFEPIPAPRSGIIGDLLKLRKRGLQSFRWWVLMRRDDIREFRLNHQVTWWRRWFPPAFKVFLVLCCSQLMMKVSPLIWTSDQVSSCLCDRIVGSMFSGEVEPQKKKSRSLQEVRQLSWDKTQSV